VQCCCCWAPAAVDQYLLPAGPAAANAPDAAAVAQDETDREADGQMYTVLLHILCEQGIWPVKN